MTQRKTSSKNKILAARHGFGPGCQGGAQQGTRARGEQYLDSPARSQIMGLPILFGTSRATKQNQSTQKKNSLSRCPVFRSKRILRDDKFDDVATGFEINGPVNKFLPADHPVMWSLITIQVDPTGVEVVEDTFKPGKIKLHFRDGQGNSFRFTPITDLGFYQFAQNHHDRRDLATVNQFLWKQSEVFLRLGLGREYQGKFWIQANGIYTFPDYIAEIRSYS
jgi:hypothetical protein